MKTKHIPKEGDLRVWWVPQVPGNPFHWSVKNIDEAVAITEALAEYDKFQFENRIKPDYCNAGGLEVFEDGDWSEWYDGKGNDIDDTKKARSPDSGHDHGE